MGDFSPSAWPTQKGSSPSTSSSENDINTTGIVVTAQGGAQKRRPKQQPNSQPRQVLSCTQCRARKVKCDRTKPCSACCARGHPRDCHFVVTEGSDYKPIQQSYEIRKLRAENIRLKERLRAKNDRTHETVESSPHSPEDESGATSKAGQRTRVKPTASMGLKQRLFKSNDPADSIYFGSPGMANIIHDFEKLQMGKKPSKSLAHIMPRGAQIYNATGTSSYPFPTLWQAFAPVCIPELALQCLPPDKEVFEYLAAFQKRAQICAFPHVPDEITESEIKRFLQDRVKNAEKSPEMLALIFAALALGAHNGSYDRLGGKWVAERMKEECLKGDVWLAASFQALRVGSFMSHPTLLGLQAVIMMCPYLTNTGRFLDAWTLFGTAIRLAHSVGLHRNPKFLDPMPSLKECTVRQALWWWMLHVDQQYSATLGRPLGISGIGDCPPPEQLTTNATILRLGEFTNKFTVLARQILSSDKLSNSKIDDFTDRLTSLWETMPEVLRFNDDWLDPSYELPDWPLDAIGAVFHGKTHNFIILLNRQRLENGPSRKAHPLSSINDSGKTTAQATYSQLTPHPSGTVLSTDQSGSFSSYGRALVISSSVSLLSAFLFYERRLPAALMCWTMGQLAFNASMILILDALETNNLENIWKVEQAYAVFCQQDENGIHKLARLARGWISWGLESLRRMGLKKEHERQQQQQQQQQADHRPSTSEDVSASNPAFERHHHPSVEGPLPPLCPPMDTVMSNTGMFLLEDPGLQSSKPEAFAPLSWNMAGTSLSSRPAYSSKGSHGPLQHHHHHHHHGLPASSVMHGHLHHDYRRDSTTQLPPSQPSSSASADLIMQDGDGTYRHRQDQGHAAAPGADSNGWTFRSFGPS